MPLAPELRRELERAVVQARETAEAGARATLAVLGVEAAAAPSGLSAADRGLRNALRARGRSLGIDSLVEEIAYEQWHRMLFARFLAENGLLIHSSGAPVRMSEVSELAAEGGETDPWVLAANYGAAMLPGIFRTSDPAHQVRFAPEHRRALEAILTALPAALFTADDALGWVYQFWQAKRKDEVNKSGRKIGGADLAPVTQLFTEHYMVRFLLENSLGAWWAARHPASPLLRDWIYLRFRDDGTPAAGAFAGWPDRAAEITVMDPCCGSGHFLVAAADMLRGMRMEEEALSATDAAAAVLRDNLFGLELDPRCTQLAAFALAFDAWKAGGYVPLAAPNIACSGIAVKGQLDDWRKLAGDDDNMRAALERLYALFQDAPDLGSLIDPAAAAGEGLWKVDPDALLTKLEKALKKETDDPVAAVFGDAAQGTAKAARLLSRKYWLVATNPPFLGRGAQTERLREYLSLSLTNARSDLAAAITTRWTDSITDRGAAAIVLPTALTVLKAYADLREAWLVSLEWRLISPIGAGAFSGISGHAVNVVLAVVGVGRAQNSAVAFVQATGGEPTAIANALRRVPVRTVPQLQLARSPESRLILGDEDEALLSAHATAYQGLGRGDGHRFDRRFWELRQVSTRWTPILFSPQSDAPFSGREVLMLWEGGKGALATSSGAVIRGRRAWGAPYVFVARTGRHRSTLALGEMFAENGVALVPKVALNLPAIWCFVQSPDFGPAVLRLSSKLVVPTASMTQVPFDLEHWQKVAAERYPNGLPEPHSDDPTQWLFQGHPKGSTAPLQVAVARLLGYCWPDQKADALDALVDADGIVTLPALAGEASAAERLRTLLARALGSEWSTSVLDGLLTEGGSPGATLETWLRDDFFAQHARLFHNRPFIWHIWDGRRDGFAALLNYHRLDRGTLEKLTYSYLNEWIQRQRALGDEPAAETRLVAALDLQRKLKLILEGEPPYDIYVRWKDLAHQPIGWEPDLDDGVRLNIRPFVEAGILRSRFTINWNKDRGTDPNGRERLNHRHYTKAEKLAAGKRDG
jgi:hypothetical protein